MTYAALNPDSSKGLGPHFPLMNVTMLVNAKGKVCLVHDQPFPAIPIWVKYKKASRTVDILFDDGSTLLAYEKVPDPLDSYLVNSSRVTIIRTENKEPIEGWETILLNETN